MRSSRTTVVVAVVAVVVAGVWAGCTSDRKTADADAGDDSGAADASASAELPTAVEDVLMRNCLKCHADPPQKGPFPLVTWQDTHALAPGDPRKLRVYELMKMRINDPDFPMPPDNSLSAADRMVLNTWIDDGAPPK